MKAAGVPFSGKYEWVETRMFWPLTHLVTPKEKALTCNDCHQRESRLSGLTACWIPGRDRSLFLDILGMLMVAGCLIGVAVHGSMRYSAAKKSREEKP